MNNAVPGATGKTAGFPTSRVIYGSTLVLVIVSMLMPPMTIVSGPVLLALGALGRLEAKRSGASTFASNFALVVGAILILVVLAGLAVLAAVPSSH